MRNLLHIRQISQGTFCKKKMVLLRATQGGFIGALRGPIPIYLWMYLGIPSPHHKTTMNHDEMMAREISKAQRQICTLWATYIEDTCISNHVRMWCNPYMWTQLPPLTFWAHESLASVTCMLVLPTLQNPIQSIQKNTQRSDFTTQNIQHKKKGQACDDNSNVKYTYLCESSRRLFLHSDTKTKPIQRTVYTWVYVYMYMWECASVRSSVRI
jgi:hypothetical protein